MMDPSVKPLEAAMGLGDHSSAVRELRTFLRILRQSRASTDRGRAWKGLVAAATAAGVPESKGKVKMEEALNQIPAFCWQYLNDHHEEIMPDGMKRPWPGEPDRPISELFASAESEPRKAKSVHDGEEQGEGEGEAGADPAEDALESVGSGEADIEGGSEADRDAESVSDGEEEADAAPAEEALESVGSGAADVEGGREVDPEAESGSDGEREAGADPADDALESVGSAVGGIEEDAGADLESGIGARPELEEVQPAPTAGEHTVLMVEGAQRTESPDRASALSAQSAPQDDSGARPVAARVASAPAGKSSRWNALSAVTTGEAPGTVDAALEAPPTAELPQGQQLVPGGNAGLQGGAITPSWPAHRRMGVLAADPRLLGKLQAKLRADLNAYHQARTEYQAVIEEMERYRSAFAEDLVSRPIHPPFVFDEDFLSRYETTPYSTRIQAVDHMALSQYQRWLRVERSPEGERQFRSRFLTKALRATLPLEAYQNALYNLGEMGVAVETPDDPRGHQPLDPSDLQGVDLADPLSLRRAMNRIDDARRSLHAALTAATEALWFYQVACTGSPYSPATDEPQLTAPRRTSFRLHPVDIEALKEAKLFYEIATQDLIVQALRTCIPREIYESAEQTLRRRPARSRYR